MYDLDTYCWFQDFVLGLVEHTLTLKMHELSGPHWQLYAQRERERGLVINNVIRVQHGQVYCIADIRYKVYCSDILYMLYASKDDI